MKVIILCGISGSGKSTIAKEIGSGYVVSADDFFMASGEYKFDPSKLPEAHGQCLRKFVGCLQYGCDTIVVDNTNTTMMEVAPYAALALAYGYELVIKIVNCDPETAHARNLHGVPLDGIKKQAERLTTLKKYLLPWWAVEEIL